MEKNKAKQLIEAAENYLYYERKIDAISCYVSSVSVCSDMTEQEQRYSKLIAAYDAKLNEIVKSETSYHKIYAPTFVNIINMVSESGYLTTLKTLTNN